jgi:hypothetical protein
MLALKIDDWRRKLRRLEIPENGASDMCSPFALALEILKQVIGRSTPQKGSIQAAR